MYDGTGQYHKAQVIVSGGGGLAIVLMVFPPSPLSLLCCVPSLVAAHLDGFMFHFEA